MTEPAKILGWWQIFGIVALVCVTTGLVVGLVGQLLGRSLNGSAGVGAAGGITAALLIARRRAAVSAQRSG